MSEAQPAVDANAPALLLTQLKWSPLRPSDELQVVLVAHFQPTEVQRGGIVKTTLYVACSGATFLLTIASGGLIRRWTSEARRNAQREIETTSGSTVLRVPKLVAKLPSEVALEGVGSTRTHSERSTSAFGARADTRLTALCYAERKVRWSYDMDRAPSEVRDYLEETIELEALVTVERSASALTVESSSQAKDRTFFGADRRKLSSLASFALYARLRAAGVPIPEPDPIHQRVSVLLEPHRP